MAKDAKRELVEFLVRRAFDPVLRAGSGGSDANREELARVQDATRAESERVRAYGSAEEVAAIRSVVPFNWAVGATVEVSREWR